MRLIADEIMRRFITRGRLDVIYADGTRRRYGGGAGRAAAMWVKTARAERGLVLNSGLAFGEGYMDGEIEPAGCTLEDVLSVLMENLQDSSHVLNRLEGSLRFARRHIERATSLAGARRNVAHHYDLNGTLYKLFLDDDLQYSCAYFERDDMTLEEAQAAKKRHIALKLKLDRPDLRVLDIGSGWGGMALTLAKDFGARVTGITLSREQLDVSRRRVAEVGLEDRVEFRLLDYRALDERFDRIVSVGMFEHVGVLNYDVFFGKIRDCLTDDGVALLHSIGRMDGPGSTNPWLRKYIFPGGYSPALSETLASVERSGLWVTDCEVLRLHYARTIALWRERFAAHRDEIRALYDERFCRMFEFYLVGAELSFRLQGHMNFQVQLTRSIGAVPLTRDYMVGGAG